MKNSDEKNIKSVLSVLRNTETARCPAPGQLDLYSRQGDMPQNERAALERHLEICPMCMDAVIQLASKDEAAPSGVWEEAKAGMDQRFKGYVRSFPAKVQNRPARISVLKRLGDFIAPVFSFPYISYAGAAAVLVFCSLYGYAWLSRPAYFDLAHFEPEKRVFRSVPSASKLDSGTRALYRGRYQQAQQLLEGYISDHPENFAAHYYLGLAYLSMSKVKLLGLHYRFDREKVDNGIEHLETALELGADNNLYREKCLWYLGKAHVMAGEPAKARQHFTKITQIEQANLVRKQDASDMLMRLETIK